MLTIMQTLTPRVADAALAFVDILPDGTGIALACSGLALVAFAMAKARALIETPAAEPAATRYLARPLHDPAECDLHFDLERVAMEIYPGARLLSQVSMAEFLHPEDGSFGAGLERERVDFLLVDARFQPFCALEYLPLRDAGHMADERAEQARNETPKRQALRQAGVPLIEVPWHYDREFLREKLDVLPSVEPLGAPVPQPARKAAPRAPALAHHHRAMPLHA